jgi:ATP-binding cassette subfamily B (MDR/TAP) protein 1
VEHFVQLALALAAQYQVALVVSHRVSTIRGAENVVVRSQGYISEQGNHIELIDNLDAYSKLVEKQHISKVVCVSLSNPDGKTE